jgi:hypothetical protein
MLSRWLAGWTGRPAFLDGLVQTSSAAVEDQSAGPSHYIQVSGGYVADEPAPE